MNRNALIAIAVLLTAAAGYYAYSDHSEETRLNYTFGKAEVGDIESVVIASGTLTALNTVVVGSQLSGQISELHVDFNSPVQEGEIIARIDPRTFDARVKQNRAEVEIAQANITQQQANLVKAQVSQREASRELDRRKMLIEQGHVSASDLDSNIAAVDTANAQIQIAQAEVETAKAQLTQRKAALAQSELDLDRTYIRSPVGGTVIERNIELGQTVAASLQAPNLFTIAQDLHRMEVEASVDEADIGQISEGLNCRFTVDAYPERNFRGRIKQIRKAPNVVQNVVTYKVIISADNSDLSLLPGMTANVEMILGRKEQVLKVPNAALRFAPRREEESQTGGPGLLGQFMPRFGPPGPPGGMNRNRSQPGAAAASEPGGAMRGSAGGNPMQMAERVQQSQQLTDQEKKAVLGLFEKQREQMAGMFRSGLPREQMRAQMQEARGKMMEELRGMLSDEQLASIGIGGPEGKPGTVWVLADDGEPAEKQILIGLADEQSTEVVSGLKEGDQVIVRATRSPI